jgi:dihydropyrimidinase
VKTKLCLRLVTLIGGFVCLIAHQTWAEDLLIVKGTVVTAEGVTRTDIRVRGDRIVELGDLSSSSKERVIDAEGLLVLPGGIDPHVHVVAQPGIDTMVDDYTAVSRSAFAGGITTVGQMAFPADVMNELPLETLAREQSAIEQQSMADVFLHVTLFTLQEAAITQIAELAELGHPSVKVYMPFLGSQDKQLMRLLAYAREAGVTVLVHCEDEATIVHSTSELVRRGHSGIAHYKESRPAIAEEIATHRVARMAEATGATVYIVHLSSADALVAIGDVTAPAKVYVETRPMYLHLTEEIYRKKQAQLFVGMPPVRSLRDQQILWEQLASGNIDTIGSDHAPWTKDQKLDPTLNLINFPTRAGVSSIQTMLPMLLSEGVGKGRMSLSKFVEITSTNPARIFGLFPRKGTIAVGSDADIVLWDQSEVRTIQDSDLFSNAGYSIYSGTRVSGWPKITIRRGEVVFERGKIFAKPGSGRLLVRDSH